MSSERITPPERATPAPARQLAPRGRPSTLCRGEDSAFADEQRRRAARDAQPPIGSPQPGSGDRLEIDDLSENR